MTIVANFPNFFKVDTEEEVALLDMAIDILATDLVARLEGGKANEKMAKFITGGVKADDIVGWYDFLKAVPDAVDSWKTLNSEVSVTPSVDLKTKKEKPKKEKESKPKTTRKKK